MQSRSYTISCSTWARLMSSVFFPTKTA
jgi:hypothetical protein